MSKTAKSLQGQFLLDGGKLQGSFFQHTVVLICQHNAEGAFGLVLNRATTAKVGEAMVANIPDTLKSQPLFIGGPVQPTALSFLHSDIFLPQSNVMLNLSLGHSLDQLLELGDSYSATQKVRLFAGYAGWTSGQLEKELARKDWLTHPASLDLIFGIPPEELWKKILLQKDKRYRLLASAPEDLSSN